MSFEENVNRRKSTRWMKASQANYDGDDWSDDGEENDDYYGESYKGESKSVPKLPEIPQEYIPAQTVERDDDEFSYGTAPTPEVTLEKKFQTIDLDDDDDGESVKDTLKSPTDEYAQIIKDNEADDDDEYTPQTVGRFHAVSDDDLDSPATQTQATGSPGYSFHEPAYEGSEDGDDEDDDRAPTGYVVHNSTSVFSPFPSESDVIVPGEREAFEEEDEEDYNNESTPAPEDKDTLAVDQPPQPPRSPVVEDINYSDDEDDEYIPQSGRFQSQLEDNPLDRPATPPKKDEPPYTGWVSPADEHHHDADDDEEYVPRSNRFTSSVVVDDDDDDLSIPAPQPRSNSNNLTINAPSPSMKLAQPPQSPAAYELSDADTLHIHDPDAVSSSPSVQEVADVSVREEPEVIDVPEEEEEMGDTSRLSRYEDLAYLSDLISTPHADNFELPKFESEEEEMAEEPVEPLEPLEASPNKHRQTRDSQFYTSVNDYFDDYADEGLLKEPLGVMRTHSSGSLSTGGFSIKSEGYRSSKLSDRTASFTGDRTASFTNQSVSDIQSTHGSTKEGTESHLNPAMSINLGQWRPNTDSFRDQFISGTGGAAPPPLPKINDYSRNSRGEIIEDNASMAESITPSQTDSDFKKRESVASSSTENTQHNTSMLSVLDDDEEDEELKRNSKDLKDGTSYVTGSDTKLPVHIPLGTPDSSDGSKPKGHYFHEHLSDSSTTVGSKKIPARKSTTFNMKQIATIENPQLRIKKYREAREEAANVNTGIEIWINQALEKVDVVSYKSPVTSHVKQAYAEASQFSRKHTNMNMGSFLNKRKVLQETSSSAHSIAKGAKGIFSRGKKMIKNNN